MINNYINVSHTQLIISSRTKYKDKMRFFSQSYGYPLSPILKLVYYNIFFRTCTNRNCYENKEFSIQRYVNIDNVVLFTKILNESQFPSSGDAHNFATYHISSSGSDDNTCGGSTDTACRSLEHVLRPYYKSQHTSGLEIITSKSLVIDQHLMVRFIFPT